MPTVGGKTGHSYLTAPRQLLTGGFNRSVQHQSQSIGRGFETQGLSRTLIEPQGDRVQVVLREAREIGSSWEILSQQAVGVLVAAALPGAAWIAEINLHLGGNREAFVPDISLPWSHVRERRSSSGSLRMCLASVVTTVVVSFLGSLTSIVKRLWRSTSVAMCVSFAPV